MVSCDIKLCQDCVPNIIQFKSSSTPLNLILTAPLSVLFFNIILIYPIILLMKILLFSGVGGCIKEMILVCVVDNFGPF